MRTPGAAWQRPLGKRRKDSCEVSGDPTLALTLILILILIVTLTLTLTLTLALTLILTLTWDELRKDSCKVGGY